MQGLKELTVQEMEKTYGGKCNSNYGYYFCCPATNDQLRNMTNNYLKESKDKAKKYVQFCYEDCGYR